MFKIIGYYEIFDGLNLRKIARIREKISHAQKTHCIRKRIIRIYLGEQSMSETDWLWAVSFFRSFSFYIFWLVGGIFVVVSVRVSKCVCGHASKWIDLATRTISRKVSIPSFYLYLCTLYTCWVELNWINIFHPSKFRQHLIAALYHFPLCSLLAVQWCNTLRK